MQANKQDAENEALIARIAALTPVTMSWSNIVDYFEIAHFHDLARRCSYMKPCIHYGYSMNWPTHVVGANILDYDQTVARNKTLVRKVLDDALGVNITTYAIEKILGWDSFFCYPLRDNPLNLTDRYLARQHADVWVSAFLSPERVRGFIIVNSQCIDFQSPLCRTNTAIYMKWHYIMLTHSKFHSSSII